MFVLCLGLIGCATGNVKYMKESGKGSIVDIFENPKNEVYDAAKEAIPINDLVLRKENYKEGIIVATPDRGNTLGKVLGSGLLTPLFRASYVGVYFYIKSEGDKTKLEIVETYDNPMNPGRSYKAALMNRIKEKLERPDRIHELQELFEMKEKNLITEEDYNIKKKEILGIK